MIHSYLINAFEAVSIALQFVLAVRYWLQGSLLRYPLLLVYCLVASLTGAAEYLVQNYGSHELFIKMYYTDEVGVDLLLFLMVITLTYRAMEGNPNRQTAGKALAVITLVVLVLPFLLFHQSLGNVAVFFNGAGEVLNFGAAIMNLVLWTALLGVTRRDGQLIMVCAGLGLQVTAQAVGFGIRQLLSSAHRWMPDLFMAAACLVSIYIWWRAFQPAPRSRVEIQALADSPAHQ